MKHTKAGNVDVRIIGDFAVLRAKGAHSVEQSASVGGAQRELTAITRSRPHPL